ncbi:S-layer homology domain-containing protein [Oscillibacter valericigenes]|nr:S-layer homology domain-containing protein [Oscillibacter valericigenes]
MKKMSILTIALLLLSLNANAIMQSPMGADYGMGPHAIVSYAENNYDLQTVGVEESLKADICSHYGWTNKEQFAFINGKIYNSDYPNGVPESSDFLTLQEFVYEYGRYTAFCRKLPQAISSEFGYIVFRDIDGKWDLTGRAAGQLAATQEERIRNVGAPWYVYSVYRTAQEGYFSGYRSEDVPPAYLFGPERNITRAELISVIMAGGRDKQREYDNRYSDVPQNKWYYSAVSSAYEAGILNEDAGKLSPEEPASREFTAALLASLAQIDISTNDISFLDADDISIPYREAVEGLAAAQVIKGYPDGRFAPEDPVTRAEVAAMLNRIMEHGLLKTKTPAQLFADNFVEQHLSGLDCKPLYQIISELSPL